jgi:hypothetical protein
MIGTPFYRAIDGVARVPAELQDFSLSNVMVYLLCELLMVSIVNTHVYDRLMKTQYSGRVIGFINFEAATIAPLWECSVIPQWLQDHPDDPESSHEGGSKTDIFCVLPCFQWWKIPADTWSG